MAAVLLRSEMRWDSCHGRSAARTGYRLSRKDVARAVVELVFFCEKAVRMHEALTFGWMRRQLRAYGSRLEAGQHG